jgi:hypothetical protein
VTCITTTATADESEAATQRKVLNFSPLGIKLFSYSC